MLPWTDDASSEARNATTAATLSAVINPRGGRDPHDQLPVGASGTSIVCTCGVSMPPGHTQFTRSGALRYSTASALVSPTIPCLAAVYAAE